MFNGRQGGLLLCLIAAGILYFSLGRPLSLIRPSTPSTPHTPTLTKQESLPEHHQVVLEKWVAQIAQNHCVACKGQKVLKTQMEGKSQSISCPFCVGGSSLSQPIFKRSEELCVEYQRNPQKTLKEYQNQKLILTGKVKGLGSIISGEQTRFWFTLEGSENVALNCELLPDFRIVRESQGKFVSAIGTFSKEQKKNSEIQITDCFLLPFDP
jgi:hypothetical protein